jgi:hypothetical protein
MEIIIEDVKVAGVLTLKRLAHWLPIKAKEMDFTQIKNYVDDTLLEARNIRLSCCSTDPNTFCVYLNSEVVIMIEKE